MLSLPRLFIFINAGGGARGQGQQGACCFHGSFSALICMLTLPCLWLNVASLQVELRVDKDSKEAAAFVGIISLHLYVLL
jgi:hypothetical protein